MMRPKGIAHPSGHPIRTRVVKSHSVFRIPDNESNVPRLRPIKNDLDCIGFIRFPVERSGDDE
jgi:hypothetical protein